MKNKIVMGVVSHLTAWVLFLGVAVACSGGSDSETIAEEVRPENLQIATTLQGTDTFHTNGDGTGMVAFKASAVNAVKYELWYNNILVAGNTTGDFEYQFKKEGTNSYEVEVIAFSKTNHNIRSKKALTVYVHANGFNDLVWFDDFDGTSAALNASKWTYDLGDGCPNVCGWGNGEQQYYTDRTDNVKVENGMLKITAKKEALGGKQYTSARIKTQGKFSFTYGRLEVLAKLPASGGTWPAIWMLGDNITSVGWPKCGEIDIMEHRGNFPGEVSCALHTESSSGNTINKGAVSVQNVSDAFHLYAVEWTEDKLAFYVDNNLFYTYQPASKTEANWPFYQDQFIILNVAVGGTLGGEIPAAFNDAQMVVEYVKLYQ